MSTPRPASRSLGRKIVSLRMAAGVRRGRKYTQSDLADQLGVTKGTISNWENGRGVNEETVALVEGVLGVSLPTPGEDSPPTIEELLHQLEIADREVRIANDMARRLAVAQRNP